MSKKKSDKTEHSTRGDTEVVTEERVVTRSPKSFKVLLLNDDYTTMDFVVSILESVFKKTPSEAVRIMLQVHHQGAGICGIFPKQIAETKVKLVHEKARAAGFPLCCAMEEA
jgi:ATP-dependent Clp protease adaptor protein ClpS